jgi:hypothetical protein
MGVSTAKGGVENGCFYCKGWCGKWVFLLLRVVWKMGVSTAKGHIISDSVQIELRSVKNVETKGISRSFATRVLNGVPLSLTQSLHGCAGHLLDVMGKCQYLWHIKVRKLSYCW